MGVGAPRHYVQSSAAQGAGGQLQWRSLSHLRIALPRWEPNIDQKDSVDIGERGKWYRNVQCGQVAVQ